MCEEILVKRLFNVVGSTKNISEIKKASWSFKKVSVGDFWLFLIL